MYLNTFLIRFGFDTNDFVNELAEPFKTDNNETVYNVRQKQTKSLVLAVVV